VPLALQLGPPLRLLLHGGDAVRVQLLQLWKLRRQGSDGDLSQGRAAELRQSVEHRC
jgi:hypothetical protein